MLKPSTKPKGKPSGKLKGNKRNDGINFNKIVDRFNTRFLQLRDELIHLAVPSFDSSNLTKTTCISQSADITVAHRIISKFGEPAQSSLQEVAFRNYLKFENELASFPQIDNLWVHRNGLPLRKAKMLLSQWFKTFHLDYNNLDVEFTMGETYIPSAGHVSVFAKLTTLSHWTCTHDVVDDVCHLVYHNRSIKAIARKHIGRMVRLEDESGFETFCRYLIPLLTIVPGARGASVPKNQDTDRFINVEPMFNVILQRVVASEIKRCLTLAGNHLGSLSINTESGKISYSDAQELHKRMIKNLDYATVDFSNASDSVLCWVIDLLFPEKVKYLLKTYRSKTVKVGGVLHTPLKLSSMGNGFTFEVMTILLLAIGRTFDSTCRVYGDDVIIRASVAERFIDVLSDISFTTNSKKTFLTGLFRESCGAFQHESVDIISYEFTWCSCYADTISLCNKLLLIVKAGQISDNLKSVLERAHHDLMALIPRISRGPIPYYPSQHLSSYCYDDNWLRSKRLCETSREMFNTLVRKNWGFFASTQTPLDSVCIVKIPMYVPKYQKVARDWQLADDLSSLYALRSTRPVIRGKGRWVNIPFVITDIGIYRFSRIKKMFPNIGEYPLYKEHMSLLVGTN